jgi:signal transduction histidine kinase/ActR/RegA family two-component response regulator
MVGRRSASILLAYALGVAAPVAALGIGMLMRPISYDIPFMPFFLAVACVSRFAGPGPGAVAIVLSALLANIYFLPPHGEMAFGMRPLTATAMFVAVASIIHALTRLLRRAQRERTEALDQLQSVFTLAHVPVAVFEGPDHVFTLANPAFRALFPGVELVGRKIGEALPELVELDVVSILDRVYRTGERQVGSESPIHLKGNPELRYFDFLVDAVRDNAGHVTGVISINVDVTSQVLARRRLEVARSKAESSDRAKDEFLAMLGHELRNPLSPIVTALELMKIKGGAASRERQVIERQVNHLLRLVDDLLDVSRVARGKIALRRETLDLSQVVAKAVEMADPLLEQRAHRLEIDVPPGLRLSGDAIRLAQVFANLLSNAAKYTDAGGHISIEARTSGGRVQVSVSDDGVGIAPELLPRVFDMFVQGHRSVDRGQGGMGLGLALVRNLVKLHGGNVTVHSPGVGRGSQFTVELPLLAEAEAAAPMPQAETDLARAAAPMRILVVDDNVDAATTLGDLLRDVGHSVVVAHDGPSALEASGQFAPDLAILDIGLPVMDGYELATRLRERFKEHSPYLVALTGYGQPSDRARSSAAGFDLHLVKPIDANRLLDVIGQAPDQR